MFPRKLTFIALLLFLLLLLGACNYPAAPQANTPDSGAIYTQAAQTVMAELTQGVPLITPSATSNPGTDPVQSDPTEIVPLTATPTQYPTWTSAPEPTATSVPPTATSVPPTPTPIPCHLATFVKDVTIPDGSEFMAGESFTKIWRLKNAGACSWTRDYSLVFVGGDQMGPASVAMPEKVEPGETVDIAINLTAPNTPDEYKGSYMLATSSGARFGIGTNADKAFWVLIDVTKPKNGIVYSFVKNYCQAEWETAAGKLPCPGRGVEPSGFVLRLDEPRQENRDENEPALWTQPQMVTNGWISGTYPAFTIQDGDQFLADIGCLAANEGCDVKFQVLYRIKGDAQPKLLGEWREVYDGKITRVEIDLSELDGKQVEFILLAHTNGIYDDDAPFWLQPQIYRP